MPRRKNPAAEQELQLFVEQQKMADWAARPAKKKRSMPASTVARATAEMREMIEKQDWATAKPVHFLALYSYLHTEVYGVEPVIGASERSQATLAAWRALTNEFAGDRDAMADFMRACWRKERAREAARRSGRIQSDFRIGWRFQFGGKMITDYRIDRAREMKGGA